MSKEILETVNIECLENLYKCTKVPPKDVIQLANFYLRKKQGGTTVFKSKRGGGRKTASQSLQNLPKPYRNYLLPENEYTDIDISNSQPCIILELFKKFNKSPPPRLVLCGANRNEFLHMANIDKCSFIAFLNDKKCHIPTLSDIHKAIYGKDGL
ncbi:MAG: hypothetical protein AABY22_04295, partial [Nanoarchaeota archaeon]